MVVRAVAWSCVLSLGLVACSSDPGTGTGGGASSTSAPPSTDAEYEQLKRVTPVDACSLLTTEKLKAIFPDQTFSVHDKLAPQLSGYVWDSRCTQWAGVGAQPSAPDVPTHSVDVFVATAASEEKAKRNLATRQETAVSATGYRAQAALGPSAYSIVGTGFARLFFVKGQSEIQVNVSYLTSNEDERLGKAVTLAQSL